MVSTRRLIPRLAALFTCMLLSLVLTAVVSRYRNTEVATELTGMVCPELTAQDAKIALVEMFRRYAIRDSKRCRNVWGSPEPDRQLATLPIRTNSDGTSQIGIFTAPE